MFDNVGSKIKGVAQVITWIGIIASVIGGFSMIATDEDLIPMGLLIMILGSLLSWLSSLTLYGFGQLVENSDILVEQNRQKYNNVNTNSNDTGMRYAQPQREPQHFSVASEASSANTTSPSYVEITCPNCKKEFSVSQGNTTATCPYCGTNLKISYS